MDRSEFIEALHLIEKEKGIDKEIIFEAIEASLVSACKKNFGSNQNIKVVIDRETGNVACYAQREVVEEVMDEQNEIDLMAARILNPSYQIGDTVDLEVTPRDFGRVAAQTAKQVVVQKFREAEREILFNQYISKEKEVVIGIVQRTEKKNVIVQRNAHKARMDMDERRSLGGMDHVPQPGFGDGRVRAAQVLGQVVRAGGHAVIRDLPQVEARKQRFRGRSVVGEGREGGRNAA